MSPSTMHKSAIVISIIAFQVIIGMQTVKAQNINEEVTVIGAFEPKIPDANKINMDPPESASNIELPKMVYNNQPVQILVSLKPESIAAVKLVGEPQQKLYRNYAKVGLGSYQTPYAEFYASSLRSKTYSLGLHFKHLSTKGKIKDHPISSNSLNMIDLYGQRYFGKHTLSGDIGFRRNVVHHYGFKFPNFTPDAEPSEYVFSNDDLKQRFNRLHASVGIKSNYIEDDRFNHFVDLKFRSIGDLFDTKETNVAIHAGADKRFELLDFTDHQQLGLTTDINYTIYSDSLLNQNSTLVSLKPFISTSFNEYSLKVGLNINFKLDTVSKAYLAPFVEGRLRIIDDALVAHIGITGGVKRQAFDDLSDTNPYVQSILPLQYTREKFAFYGGLSARVGSNLDFNAQVRSSVVENAAFFINDYSMVPFNRFTMVHDNGNLLEGRFEAQYHSAENIVFKAFVGFESWRLNTLQEPWHTPTLKYGVDAMYHIQNNIILRANVAARSSQYARVINDLDQIVAQQIKGFADISVGAEYRYTKALSGFINFNNLTNTRYYVWNNYPSYRFNVMGGVTYSF